MRRCVLGACVWLNVDNTLQVHINNNLGYQALIEFRVVLEPGALQFIRSIKKAFDSE